MKNNYRKTNGDAYSRIHDMIVEMAFKPGEVITEAALSEALSIGRTPVREALKKIEQEGLIYTANHRKRIYILTLKELEEIFDIKTLLESFVAECAAKNCTPQDAKQLQIALKAMETAVGLSTQSESEEKKRLNDWHNADRKLHHLIYKMADKPKIEPIIQTLNLQWLRLKLGIYTLEGRMKIGLLEHKNVVQAIIDKNPEKANKLMRSHLKNVCSELIKIFRMFNYPPAF